MPIFYVHILFGIVVILPRNNYAVNHSLSKQAYHSCDIIAFLPDTNSSEYLTYLAFIAAYLCC